VIIEVRPHAVFQRHDNDILTEVTVSVSRAILGSEIEVPTLDAKVMMKVPAGTQSGRTFVSKKKACRTCTEGRPG